LTVPFLEDDGFAAEAPDVKRGSGQPGRHVAQALAIPKKLGNHEFLAPVRRFVGEHHERFDGAGYPKKLRGDQISMEGRILCVAEVFDSLATKRSYKEVWELTKTIDFFASQRAKAFDPEVLDPFLDLLEVHGDRWMRAPREDLAAAGLAAPAPGQG
jgi:HD-GYP domain-containing protein (c-di-GMP phosphodiesterase class II)